MCGTDNCRSSLGFHSQFDCCYSVQEDFCTIENPCGADQGDCDSHDVCQVGLGCGLNNCPVSLGYDSAVDCCYSDMVGGDQFCTNANPCGQDQGDCDSHDECQDDLECGVRNCPESHGFTKIDCCQGCCEKIIVTYSTEYLNVNPSYKNIYGTYLLSGTNDSSIQTYYISDSFDGNYGIWWCSNDKRWVITNVNFIGNCDIVPYAWAYKENFCVNTFRYDWYWQDSTMAGEELLIKCWDHGKFYA